MQNSAGRLRIHIHLSLYLHLSKVTEIISLGEGLLLDPKKIRLGKKFFLYNFLYWLIFQPEMYYLFKRLKNKTKNLTGSIGKLLTIYFVGKH